MELKILWTNAASRQLEEVFDFYKTTANVPVARRLVKELVAHTKILSSQPKVGQIELLLEGSAKEYRYLVHRNHKIIYWIEPANVFIAAVFDTRRNPVKMHDSVNPEK